MRSIALLLASSDIDGAGSEETIEEAMEMIEDESARVDLSGSLGLEAVDGCSSDEGYERTLSLLLSALLRESESIAEFDSKEPNDTSLGLSKAACYLILKSSKSSTTGSDLTEKAAEVLASSLSPPQEQDEEEDDAENEEFRRVVTSVMVQSLLSVARSPVGAAGDFAPPVGLYAPALVLAEAAHSANPPTVEEDEKKWNSQTEDPATAFRRDVTDLLGRRIFGMGGGAGARPATPREVDLSRALLCTLTRDEFDGAMLRPLRFRLMSSPSDTMSTLAALLRVLSNADKGSYVEPHLGGGTNLVGAMVKQLKTSTGSAGAIDVARALVVASPEKGVEAVTEAVAEALVTDPPPNEDVAVTLCGALEEVALAMLQKVQEDDDYDEKYRHLASNIVIPALEESSAEAGDAKSVALSSWNRLAGNEEAGSPEDYSSSAAPENSDASLDRDVDPDEAIKVQARAERDAATSTNGYVESVDEASRLDERIARKTAAANANINDNENDAEKVFENDDKEVKDQSFNDFDDNEDQEKALLKEDEAIENDVDSSPNLDHHQEEAAPIPIASHGISAEPDVERGVTAPDPFATAAQGTANMGGHYFDGEGEPLMDGGAGGGGGGGPGGLAVALPVSPHDDNEFSDEIVNATEYDPDAKPPLYKNRRFRVYSIAAFCLLILVAVIIVILVVGSSNGTSKKGPSTLSDTFTPAPTSPPTSSRDNSGIYEVIAANLDVPVEKVRNKNSGDPVSLAADWIVNRDQLQLRREEEVELMNRFALAHFYYSTKGPTHWTSCYENTTDPWNYECTHFVKFDNVNSEGTTYNGANWLSPVHHCNWFGVGCGSTCRWDQLCEDIEPKNVNLRTLQLWQINLNGTLPTELAQIDTLQHISILSNSLYGSLPREIVSMRSLTDLELNTNFLTGTIPEELFDVSQMFRLNLASNLFTGTFSTRIGDLTNMQGMYLFRNPLITGTIPTEMGNLENMINLYMDNMQNLEGTLPSEFGKIETLNQLRLNENSITGTVPIEWQNLKRLRTLYLYNCELSGPFPEAVYGMEDLTNIWIDGNSLTGTLDSKIGDLKKLSQLIVRRNNLSGTIPNELVRKPFNQSQLSFVFLHFNNFSGTVTDDFCNLYPPPETNKLILLYADCSPSNKTGPPAVTCSCCNRCCDTVTRGPCDRVEGN